MAHHPEINTPEQLTVAVFREYGAHYSSLKRVRDGQPIDPATRRNYYVGWRSFINFLLDEDYDIDLRISRLRSPQQVHKQPTVYHVERLKQILQVCRTPTEEIVIRTLVGTGMRRRELVKFELYGPDGLPDLEIDVTNPNLPSSVRVHWNRGPKLLKSRRVPVCSTLAAK